MATKESALNGLRRALNFTQDVAASTDRLYSSNLAAILEICSLAQAVTEASTLLLEREGISEIPGSKCVTSNSYVGTHNTSKYGGFDNLLNQLELANKDLKARGLGFTFDIRPVGQFFNPKDDDSEDLNLLDDVDLNVADTCSDLDAVEDSEDSEDTLKKK